MRKRLSLKINALLSSTFPEQRLYLRSDNSTRFLRLTPARQLLFAGLTVVAFSWTLIASSAFFIEFVSASTDSSQASANQVDYEQRLNALSKERDKRALEAKKAQDRFYVALEQISDQQSALLKSEDRRKELETGIEVIQRTLRTTMKERDRAQSQSDLLLTELQMVTGNLNTDAGNTTDLERTLDFLNSAFAKTINERDTMIVSSRDMAHKVDALQHQASLTEERNERIFSRLEEAVTVSISPLETMFSNVGLSTDKLLEDVKLGYSGQGGPLTPLAVSTKGKPEDPTSLKANELLAELDKINMMRIAATRTPFVLPLKTTFRLSSGYGWRRHPKTGRTRMHDGTDFAAAYGTPVYATADGVVSYASWSGGYGRVVKITHAMGFETRYAHLAKFRVKAGQRVSRGDLIGDMGSSGRSTGSHVHYEVRIGGKSVNPMTYIKAARDVF